MIISMFLQGLAVAWLCLHLYLCFSRWQIKSTLILLYFSTHLQSENSKYLLAKVTSFDQTSNLNLQWRKIHQYFWRMKTNVADNKNRMYNFLVICVSLPTLENVHFEVWEYKHKLQERLLRLLRRGRRAVFTFSCQQFHRELCQCGFPPEWEATSNVFHWKGRRERPTFICYTFMCYNCCFLQEDNYEVFTRMLTLSLQSASKSLIALQTETLNAQNMVNKRLFIVRNCASEILKDTFKMHTILSMKYSI